MLKATSRSWGDIQERLAARPKPVLNFVGEPLTYWQGEVAVNCQVSLNRLRAICAERGCDYERTVEGLRDV
jgi:hypothetical protein